MKTMTEAQQGIWFSEQIANDSTVYCVSERVRIIGDIDINEFIQAADSAIASSPSLHLRITDIDNEPYLSYDGECPTIEVVDLSASRDPREAALAWEAQAAKKPWSPESGAITHAAVLKLSEHEHWWFLRIHHLAIDGYGFYLLNRNIAKTYQGTTKNIAIADTASLTAEPSEPHILQARSAYWSEQAPEEPITPLASGQSNSTLSAPFDVPGVTSFPEVTVALGAMALLVGSATRKDEAIVGLYAMNRTSGPQRREVSTRQNLLPLWIRFTPDESLEEFLAHVQNVIDEGLKNQDYRHESIRKDRGLSSNQPLVDATLNLIPFASTLNFGTAKGHPEAIWAGPTEGLHCEVRATTGDTAVRYSMNCPADALPQTTLHGYGEMFRNLLSDIDATRAAGRQQTTTLKELSIADATPELPTLQARFEQDRYCCPEPVVLNDVLSALLNSAAQHPQLVAPDASLNAQEVRTKIAGLVTVLQYDGIGVYVIFGIDVPRSTWSILAPIAALTCGAAFVPFDENWPAQRRQEIIDDCQPALIIDDSIIAEVVPEERHVTPAHVNAESLAYILYTSGTTGKRKGVMVPRRAFGNYLRVQRQIYLPTAHRACDNTEALKVIYTYPMDFDGAMSPFAQFMLGNHLHLVALDIARHPAKCIEYLAQEDIEVMSTSPALLEELIFAGLEPGNPTGQTPSLKYLTVGGERVRDNLWESLHRFAQYGTISFNAYGPTENTVDSSGAWIDRHVTPTIGFPLPGQKHRVIDPYGRVCPVGVAGELEVSGASLSLGYYRNEEATAAAFTADGYRTSDMVRVEEDYSLAFIARLDDQLSINGIRVEPAEIESAVLRQDGVEQAFATLVETPTGSRLCCYVVGAVDYDLREALRSVLPSSSIPTHIISIDAFPLTERGKIDKDKLPTPELPHDKSPQHTIEFEPGSIEADIAAAFQQSLGHDLKLHPDVSLFDVGADSLTVRRIIGLLAKQGYETNLATVFAHPSINGLTSQLQVTRNSTELFDYIAHDELTNAQKRIWFLDSIDGPSSAYALPVKIKFTSAIDTQALNHAFHDVCQKFPTLLKTIDIDSNGDPQIQPWTEALPGIHSAGQNGELIDCTFRLSTDLPIRAFLHTDSDGGILTVVFNHVAVDGWSLQTIVSAFGDFYRLRQQRIAPEVLPNQLPAAVRRYVNQDVTWWQDYLAGVPQEMSLPLDRPRQQERSDEGGELVAPLGAEQSEKFNDLCQELGVTPFVVAQALLAAMLYKVGAGTDIAFGTVSAGREHPDSQDYVGYLANTIPVRLDLSGNPTAQQLLSHTQSQSHELLEHGHVPFEAIVRAINPARTPGLHPLFQVMMVMQESERTAFGADTEMSLVGSGSAKFDLTVEVIRDTATGEVELRWEYAKDIFDSSTIQKLHQWYLRTFNEFISHPDKRLSDFIIDEDAHTEMVTAASVLPSNKAETQTTKTLTERVEESLRRFSTNTALISDEQRWTYQTLETQTAHIRDLVGTYAHPGDRVVILYPRGIDQVAAVIGTVRSGAAYVPVDPESPSSRIELIIADSRPNVILADETCLDLAQQLAGDVPVVTHTQSVANTPEIHSPKASDPAYLIFTSGSTGKPKGVIVPQSNPVRLFDSTDCWFNFGQDDVWMLFHSYAFDFAVWEMFGALLYGGSLVIVSNEVSRSPQEIFALIQQEHVTVLNQTPSAFSQLVPVTPADADVDLRFIIFGGEAVQPESVRSWFEKNPHNATCEVINMYGITETTVHVTYQPLSIDNIDNPPVGVPIPDLAVYLLDADGNPVPDNVVGQMYVSGAGVTQGYIGREALTAEKFIADPFSAEALGLSVDDPHIPKMYASGDLAYRKDGIMYFTGRADRQVQLRGFRIELGEIEAAASDIDEVSWAHCRLVNDGRLGQRLVLYVAVPDLATVDPTSIRARTAERLPKHMVPSLVVPIDSIPLTVNGKLDTDLLPEPAAPQSQGREPNTEIEREICRIFEDILGLSDVSAEDSFFDLGGHSMLAVVLSSRLRESLGAEVRVGTIMTSPTPELLAEAVTGALPTHADLEVLLPLRDRGEFSSATIFCIHPAGGMSWCYSGLPSHLPQDISVYGLQARGILNPDSQPGSLSDMADDYIQEMKSVQPEGPYHILGWSLGGMVTQVIAAKLSQAGEEVGLVALLDAYPSEAADSVEERSQEEALSALLAMAGLDDDELGSSPTFEDLDRVLHDANSPMAGLKRKHLEAIVRTYRNTSRILREHQHEVHDGDMVLFRAERGGIGPVHDPHEWDSFASGTVEIVDIDCSHREMTQPVPIRIIGQYLTNYLTGHNS